MSRGGYYNSRTPFLYTSGESAGGGSGGGVTNSGMDCLQLRQPPGPFHYLINEQAKSLVALQELQHEVGALLEFRDLVIETFPNLRTKLAASSSTPTTMITTPSPSTHHLLVRGGASCTTTNNTVNEWTPGVRVRKKLGTMKEKKNGDNTSTIQDSGFSTETSSKETHSASSTTVTTQSTTIAGGADETEDELWNLLDVIHRKGTRLKDEVEALQGVLKEQQQHDNVDDFQQLLSGGNGSSIDDDDLQQLRQERDLLLDRLAEMEAEVLAGRVHTSRLQEDLENLLIAKHDLEEQLRVVLQQSDQVNSRINDIHLEFITKSSPTRRRRSLSSSTSQQLSNHPINNNSNDNNLLDKILGDQIPKIKVPDREKIVAILKERDPLILQKHLLNSTVQNQVLHQQLDTATRLEIGLADKLDKAREENDELRFQLEDKNIELEGTRARVRMLEQLQKSLTTPTNDDQQQHASRTEITTASMKAMSPLPMNLQIDHSSSTESAHDQAENNRKLENNTITKRKPSKIPLKSYTAPKPPGSGGKHPSSSSSTTITTTTTTRSRSSGESPASRPHSAQSWRHRSSDGNIIINNNNNNSLSGNKSNTSLTVQTKSRNGSLITSKDSLSNKLRNSDSLTKLSNNSFGNTPNNNNNRNNTLRKNTIATNKWNSGGNGGNNNNAKDLEKVRPKSTSSFWNFFKLHNAQT